MIEQLEELHKVQLELLEKVIEICKKYNLQYYALGGTVLGTIRHKGFIPWDDDIDIGMPRDSYDKFTELCKTELEDKFFLQTYKTNNEYPLLFSKLRLNNTAFISTDTKHLNIHQGISIDIFPLDGVFKSKLLSFFQYFLVTIFTGAIAYRFGLRSKFKIKNVSSYVLSKIFRVDFLRRIAEILMRLKKYENSKFVINWLGAYGLKESGPKSFFGAGIIECFEGIKAVIPKEYDYYLTKIYNNYMKFPPVDKRSSGHNIEIIDFKKSYKEYL